MADSLLQCDKENDIERRQKRHWAKKVTLGIQEGLANPCDQDIEPRNHGGQPMEDIEPRYHGEAMEDIEPRYHGGHSAKK